MFAAPLFGQTPGTTGQPGVPANPGNPGAPAVVGMPPVRSAQTVEKLSIGDRAPAIGIETWVKGTPTNEYAEGRVYVIEFWAMGAPACKRTAPLLSEVQAVFREKAVTVIGISVADAGGRAQVEAFVKRAGDRMGYAVAYDATADAAKRFMQLTGQNSIPVAFVVDRSGRLAWVGHPLDGIDRVVDRVAAGKWDLAKAKADATRRAAAEEKSRPIIARLEEELSSGKSDRAPAIMDELVAVDPAVTADWAVTKFGYLLLDQRDADKAYAYAAAVADGAAKDNADVLKAIAWMILAEPGVPRRDTPLAKRLALRADELTGHKDANILDTLAKAQFDSGDAAAAAETQKLAIEAAILPSQKKELQQRLQQYVPSKK